MPAKEKGTKAATPRKVRQTSAGKGGAKYARFTVLLESGQTLAQLSTEFQELTRDMGDRSYTSGVRRVIEGETITESDFNAVFDSGKTA